MTSRNDPTVNALRIDAGSWARSRPFVASGTMGNLVASGSVPRGGQVIGRWSHPPTGRRHAAAVVGAPARSDRARADERWTRRHPRGVARHQRRAPAATNLLVIENTSNGIAVGRSRRPHPEVAALATSAVPVHIDGARLFNAAVALATPRPTSSRRRYLSVCLSKVSPARPGQSWLEPRRRRRPSAHRKLLGGGMRQAGVLAAAGLIAWRMDRWA
jgi:threonine aldolase